MAVSGRIAKDFQASVSLGSAEDFDHSREPCLTIGQHIEAQGVCVDCQEYLCKTCFECHKRTKASRNHHLLEKDNFGKQVITRKDTEECTEKCSVHKKEIITFFCPTHAALGCNDCIIMDHRTCKIDYIRDKCAGIGDSEEYRDTVKKLNENIEEAEKVMKKAKIRDTEIDKCQADIVMKIIDFRKEINDRLDQLQEEIQKEADKKKSEHKQLLQKVLDEGSGISSDMKNLQSRLQANKMSAQNGQLYINMKRAMNEVKSDEIKRMDETLLKTDMQYTFKRNNDLEHLLLKCKVFGELNMTSNLATHTKKKIVDNLIHKEDINVGTESDKKNCWVTGSIMLPSNKLVLVDRYNDKLKVVDTQRRAVTEEKTLDSGPWDIATMPQGQIAVTMPSQRKILVMATSGHLSDVRSIPVKVKCFGITYHQGCLYVACSNPKTVLVLDTQGKIQNTIFLNNDIFEYPDYVVLSEDSMHIYISDRGGNCVVSITLQGEISAVYKHEDLREPRGMVMLDDGSLLVCCFGNGIIHHISGDLKKGQTVVGSIRDQQSLCYNHHDEELYIGFDGYPLKVFGVK